MTFKRKNIERENKFIFNGHDLSNDVVVERINRQLLPTFINSGVSTSKSNGRKFQSSKLDTRLIIITLRFIEATYEKVQEKVQEVSSLLYSEKPCKLELRDTTKYNYAILSSMTEIEKTSYTGTCEIIFDCFDIFNYGEEVTQTLDAPIVNRGSAPTVGIINVTTLETENISIELNEETKLKFTGPFIAGSSIIIDLEKEQASINGASLMDKLSFDSDFFLVPVGESDIKINGAEGEITVKERWY